MTSRHRSQPDGEIALTDAIHRHAREHPVFGQVVDGTWWDTGNAPGYLRAQFAAALAHPEYGPELRKPALGPVLSSDHGCGGLVPEAVR